MKKLRTYGRLISMLCIVLMLLQAAGCSNKSVTRVNEVNQEVQEVKKTEKEAARGRYVEKEIPLPEGIAQENISYAFIGKDGLEAIAYDQDSEEYLQLAYRNGEWEQKKCPWYDELKEKNESLTCAAYGLDGNYYVAGMQYSNNFTVHIYRISENTLIPLTLDLFESNTNDVHIIMHLAVLQDGTVLYTDGSDFYIRSNENKEIYYAQGCNNFSVEENQILVKNQNGKRIDVLDLTGSLIQSYPVEFDIDDCVVGSYQEDIYTFSNKSGLYCCNRNGSMWQNLIDTSILTLPNVEPVAMSARQQGDYINYLVVTTNNELVYRLLSYEYDPNMLATPLEEFTIYSLNENATIRQAISAYKTAHPEIGIQYITADPNVSLNNSIRALNAELLAGNGADLLVMDGLCEPAYREKGILADLTDLVEENLANGQLTENVMESYRIEDKYYTIPAKIMIPMVYGDEKVIRAMKSLGELEKYLQIDTRADVFDIDEEAIPETFLKLYYDEIVDPVSNDLQTEALKQYARIIKDLMNRANISQNTGEVDGRNVAANCLDYGFGSFLGDEKDPVTRIEQIQQDKDIIIPYCAQRKARMSCENYHQLMVPSTVVGINDASTHKEILTGFIRMLLGEDVQSISNEDGFAVNPKVNEKTLMYEDKFEDIGSVYLIDGNPFYYDAVTEEQLNQFKSILSTVNRRYTCDAVILNMITAGVKEYIEDRQDENEFAETMKNQISLYLEE